MMSPDLAPSASSKFVQRASARHAALVACTGVAVVGTLLAQQPGLAQQQGRAQPSRRAGNVVAKASQHWEDYGGGPDSSKFVDLRQLTVGRLVTARVARVHVPRQRAAVLPGAGARAA